MLLAWSLMPHGHTLEGLRHWIGSEEGLSRYQQLIDNLPLLPLPKTLPDAALTSAALLSRERLLLQSGDDTMDRGKWDSVYFDDVLHNEDLSNKQLIYESTVISLIRTLYTLEGDNDDLIQLLINLLGKRALILEPLDSVAQHGCAKNVTRHEYSEAFKDP